MDACSVMSITCSEAASEHKDSTHLAQTGKGGRGVSAEAGKQDAREW